MLELSNMKKIEQRTILIGNEWVDYDLIWSEKRRTVAVSIAVDNNVRVFAPSGFNIVELEKFLCLKENWILKKMSETEKIRSKIPVHEYKNGESFLYMNSPVILNIKKKKNIGNTGFCSLKDNILTVSVADSIPVDKKKSVIQDIIKSWYRTQAQKYLTERVQWLSWNTGIRYSSISLSSARRTWGSCDSNDNLRFNWRIIMASEDLIDYIIIHELCHIRVKDHSKNYWSLVEKYIPDYKEKRALLKRSAFAYSM